MDWFSSANRGNAAWAMALGPLPWNEFGESGYHQYWGLAVRLDLGL